MSSMFNIDDPNLKKNPFKTPVGFKEKSEKEIWDKISIEKSKSHNKRFIISSAAAVAVLVGLFLGAYQSNFKLHFSNSVTDNAEVYETDEVLIYELSNLEEATISEVINEESISNSSALDTDDVSEYLESTDLSEFDIYASL